MPKVMMAHTASAIAVAVVVAVAVHTVTDDEERAIMIEMETAAILETQGRVVVEVVVEVVLQQRILR